jgi:hypothetical protein
MRALLGAPAHTATRNNTEGPMDKQKSDRIRQWFLDYAEAASTFDAERVSQHYTDCYVEAGPKGATCVKNDDDYRTAVSKRRGFFEGLGFKFAKIVSLDDTPLDDNYSMVKVHWQMRFEPAAGHPIDAEFDNTYFVYHKDDNPKVVCYISHQDEETMMRELGLLPAENN